MYHEADKFNKFLWLIHNNYEVHDIVYSVEQIEE